MTREFLDGLVDEVRRRFYAGAPEGTFHAHRLGLQRALTWPAKWWRERGFRTELPPARYRGAIVEVLDTIERHGDRTKIRPAGMGGSGFFPAYLLKCIQRHYAHHGEDLYYAAKPLRDAAPPTLGDCVDLAALVQGATRASSRAPKPPPAGLDLDLLAKAHALVAKPRRATTRELAQPELF